MDRSEELIIRIGVIAVMLLASALALYFSRWKNVAEEKDGKKILRYIPFYRIGGIVMLWIAVLLPLAIVILVILCPPKRAEEYWIASGLAIFFGVIGLIVGMQYRKSYAIISMQGIEKYSPWLGRRFMEWSEVERFETLPYGLLIIYGSNRKKLRFPVCWGGSAVLIEEIKKRQNGGR